MSARERLLAELVCGLTSGDFQYEGDPEEEANGLIDNLLHEEAEKIRKMPYAYGCRQAADLIDPYTPLVDPHAK